MSDQVPVSGGYLETWEQGRGDPVLLVHGSVIADEWDPVLRHPLLADYRLLHYRRRGYGSSAPHVGPCSLMQQAADAAAVLRHHELDAAHVVGHSFGASIALQLALDTPSAVRSLTLMEPPLPMVPAAAGLGEVMAPAVAAYMAGDRATAVEVFLAGLGGDNSLRPVLDGCLSPGWFEQATADVGTIIETEGPSLFEWQIEPGAVAGLQPPLLLLSGGATGDWFKQGTQWLAEQVPSAGQVVVPAIGHMLHMLDDRAVVEPIAGFLAHHPISGSR